MNLRCIGKILFHQVNLDMTDHLPQQGFSSLLVPPLRVNCCCLHTRFLSTRVEGSKVLPPTLSTPSRKPRATILELHSAVPSRSYDSQDSNLRRHRIFSLPR